MTPDHLALAKDVDRLFRARQDGRQMPVGEKVGTGTAHDPYGWSTHKAEYRAHLLWHAIHGNYPAPQVIPEFHYFWKGDRIVVVGEQSGHLRTRRHVAMLALTEPEHFRRCVSSLDAFLSKVKAYVQMIAEGKSLDPFDVQRALSIDAHGFASFVFDCHDGPRIRLLGSDPKLRDVARTARYLAELEEGLRLFGEAEVLAKVRADVAAEQVAVAERDARTESAADEDEDAFRDWAA